jgi:hypothetical protein
MHKLDNNCYKPIIQVIETRFTALEQAMAKAILLASIQFQGLLNWITKTTSQTTNNQSKTFTIKQCNNFNQSKV